MSLILDKNLTSCDAFPLLKSKIDADKLTCCEGILDFIYLVATISSVRNKLVVSMNHTGSTVWVTRELQRSTIKQVAERDLEGMRLLMLVLDPMLFNLSSAVETLTDLHIERDCVNKAKVEADNELKSLE